MATRFQASLPVAFFREGKHFIAHSSVLDLSTSGKSFEEAQKRFSEAVRIFVEELIDKGTIDEVLTGLGWSHSGANWMPPTLIAQQMSKVNISLAN